MADFIRFDVDASGLANSLGIRVNRMKSVLMSKMSFLMNMLKDRIQSVELGGAVLHRRTGTLADSVHASMQIHGSTVVGMVTSAGGDAWYGRVHLQGGRSDYLIYPVEKQALAFMFNREKIIVKGVLHPPLPMRDYMTPAITAMESTIYQGLADAVNEALR